MSNHSEDAARSLAWREAAFYLDHLPTPEPRAAQLLYSYAYNCIDLGRADTSPQHLEWLEHRAQRAAEAGERLRTRREEELA